jgi:hypothetical protein
MTKVVFKEIEISNWLEYIELKFADQNYFEIEKNPTEKEEEFIKINSKKNKTKIWFNGLHGENLVLYDCQYSNEETQSWSGETCAADPEKYGTFNQENLNTINEILETPIYKGWYSEEYYLFGEFYKAISFKDEFKKEKILTYYGSKYGCVSLVLFPIFFCLNILMKFGLFRTKIAKVIEPIIENK